MVTYVVHETVDGTAAVVPIRQVQPHRDQVEDIAVSGALRAVEREHHPVIVDHAVRRRHQVGVGQG